MLKMGRLVIRLVYFCSLSVSFLASHEHDHRPNRLDTDPDMDLMPLTRFHHRTFTTPRSMTLRDPMFLPGIPHEPKSPDDYEYYHYEDEHIIDYGMTSSGHVDDRLESTTDAQEEYVYTDAGGSNAKNEFFMNSGASLPAWRWISLFGTILTFLLL